MKPKNVSVGIIQLACSTDINQNLSKTIERIYALANEGVQIICLQELFKSLYFCNVEDHTNFALAEAIPQGESTQIFQRIAKELGIVIIASLFERRTAGLYHNTTIVIDAGGEYLGKYRKHHIPDDPGFYEKFYFTEGDGGYKVFNTKFAKIGVLICWDQWYPEPARITSLMGAEILFYPTAIGWELETSQQTNQEQYNAWQTMQRSHAIANGVYVVSVNRVGIEDVTNFWGGSFMANPMGSVIYQASHTQELHHAQTLDLGQIEHYRTIWPFLRDRRINSYSPITERFLD
jgi:N-carbamoylputrescine amidase